MSKDLSKMELESCVQCLYDYALEREDVKWLAQGLAEDGELDADMVEYELHVLKIVSIGWAVAYFLREDPLKEEILEPYWRNIRTFSEDLSRSTSLLIGKDIEYFQVLKSRLDTYVQAMSVLGQDDDPTLAIGPAFADCCGDRENPFAILAGSKMFAATLNTIREYLVAAVREDETRRQGRVQ